MCSQPAEFSTTFTRMFEGQYCKQLEFCNTILTVPEKPSEQVIVKFHTQTIPIRSYVLYDTVSTPKYVHNKQNAMTCFIMAQYVV